MKPKKLLIATQNPGKLREMKALLGDLGVSILGLSDVFGKNIPEVAETGSSYEANAKLKARTIGKPAKIPTLADDSGLEVYALDNFPGITSARWHPGSDADRNRALLKKMRDVDDRRARYVASVCIFLPTQDKFICTRGILNGLMALEPTNKIKGGFGYDSIFIPKGYDRPLAELGDDVKLKISHRTKAIKKLCTIIQPTSRQKRS